MRSINLSLAVRVCLLTLLVLSLGTTALAQSRSINKKSTLPFGSLIDEPWNTVVNNNSAIPNGTRNFSSYGQPSVSAEGTIVFRGRSTMGGHETGIYLRYYPNGKLIQLADANTPVPDPNNLATMFTEFSSFPRIAIHNSNVAFRGMHSPVYTYMLPDGTETRIGTTGIYATLGSEVLFTGASKLGLIPGFDFYAVRRNYDPAGPMFYFDVFPGGSAINDDGWIVFKGNWTEGDIGKTGIFARRLFADNYGGIQPTYMLASSDSEIPNLPPSFQMVTFDSTSPPSVAGDYVVFLGLDNEADPHAGGIYRVHLKGGQLEPLVEIGKALPNNPGTELTRIGEGLSFDGRYLAFWAAWGTEFETVRLNCPADGNRDLRDYCNGIDPNSIYDASTRQWYQLQTTPLHQGIVVMDLQTGEARVVSSTLTDFTDFVYWTYSGHVPGTSGDETSEPPRWRGASFMAVSDGTVVFKARTADWNKQFEYINIVDGLYSVDMRTNSPRSKLVETGMDGSLLDPQLSPGTMPITGLGIERDGFRGDHLAITATMANEEAGWGGVYMKRLYRAPSLRKDPRR